MSRHARPSSGRGGGWFIALAFAVLVVGAYLANAVDSTTQRPAIGLAALAGAALALVSARAERQIRQRIDELTEARQHDVWRMRSELDEAHARSLRALHRAVAAETAVHTLMAATESLLAVRHVLLTAAPAPVIAAAPIVEPVGVPSAPASPPVVATPQVPVPTPTPVSAPEPAVAAFVPTFVRGPAIPAQPVAPAAALAGPTAVPTLIWPLADLPAPRREPSLDLPLVPAPGARIPPLFVPVESPPAHAFVSSTTASNAGTEPEPLSELVDLTSTSTSRYARPA
jgi:hypothetical protein